mgnify:FL=1
MGVSDFDMHAYIDGELTDQERAVVTAHILNSQELFETACTLRSLSQLVRLAYATRATPASND